MHSQHWVAVLSPISLAPTAPKKTLRALCSLLLNYSECEHTPAPWALCSSLVGCNPVSGVQQGHPAPVTPQYSPGISTHRRDPSVCLAVLFQQPLPRAFPSPPSITQCAGCPSNAFYHKTEISDEIKAFQPHPLVWQRGGKKELPQSVYIVLPLAWEVRQISPP